MRTIHEEKKAAHQDEASHEQDYPSNPFAGKVVSITEGRLVLSNKEGNRLKISAAKNATAGSYHVTVREAGGQPSTFDFTLK